MDQASELGNPSCEETRYQEQLDRAQSRIAHFRVGESGRKKRHAIMESLDSWLARGLCPRTVWTCTPNDILVYLEDEYLPNHQGSMAASGEHCCAPSTVDQILSHMSACFAQMGRSDRWTNLAVAMQLERGSNPVFSQ